MTHQLLSQTEDWELENDDQDLRGRTVVDEQGQRLGTVNDMIVDTDTESIDRIVLDDGSEIDVRSVTVGADTLTVATGQAATAAMSGGDAMASDDDTWKIRRYAEDLQATRQREQVGEVTVAKDVVEEQQSIDVPVTREQVEIRRVAVDRPADDTAIIDDGDTIRIPVTADRVDVTKEARVVEELEIAKTERTDTEHVTDTVRREEIDIDGDVDIRGDRSI